MPEISYEALAGAALIIVLAVGYQYLPKSEGPGGASSSSSKSKKKNKKKGKGGARDSGDEAEEAKPVPVADASAGKVGKKKGKAAEPSRSTSKAASVPPPIEPQSNAPSFAEVAAESMSEGEAPQAHKPKTLAQKIAPKNRKTKVDDMLAPEDKPAEHARVMKVVPVSASSSSPSTAVPSKTAESSSQDEKIAKYEDDYQDDENTSGTGTVEDDGWDLVPSKKKKVISISGNSGTSSPATSNLNSTQPLPVDTKVQRKNAKKNEAKKAQKDAEEEDRLKRLQQHKKTLEKERIAEIYKNGKKGGASGKTDKGAFASLDTNGKLIWD